MQTSPPIESLAEAARWLDGLINRERQRTVAYSRFGLEAIEALLAALGNPERALSVIHVAGSKGKGSTALFLEAVLRALGERTGVFTSPHLLRWTERFRIDGAEVAGERLVRAVALLQPHVEALRRPDSPRNPSFFDATTAAALLLFAEARVDRAVLEVGLGGRLDSTNAVSPAVTCITTIEYEHTDKLGSTLAAIAGEKAGILKPGIPCVIGALPAEAESVVSARAAALNARVIRLGEDFGMRVRSSVVSPAQPTTPVTFWARDGFGFDAELAAHGRHQLDNAAVAVAAIRALDAHPDDAIADASGRALPSLALPARIEVVERDPWVIIDSAHTRESARALRRFLDGLGDPPEYFVLSISSDKPLEAIIDALLPPAAAERLLGITVTRAEPIRAADPERVVSVLEVAHPGVRVRIVEDPRRAVREAREVLPAGALLCVTGSIYLSGIARDVLVPS